MSKRNLIIILSLIFIIANLSNVYGETDISSNQGNFSQLNQIIDNSNNSIELDEDYKAVTFEDKISISKSVDIGGNNHSINSDRDIKLNVNNSKVVFKHINFNRNICINNCNSSDITFLDCYFNLPTNSYLIMKYETVSSSSKTDMPSIIKYFAQNIVGKSQVLQQLKNLQNGWVKMSNMKKLKDFINHLK